MSTDVKKRVSSKASWMRAVWMVLFAVILKIVGLVIGVTAVVQFLFLLFGGAPNGRLSDMGRGIAEYGAQLMGYLTFAHDTRPFPFAPWPTGNDMTEPADQQETGL